jgi:hypothetical protein
MSDICLVAIILGGFALGGWMFYVEKRWGK